MRKLQQVALVVAAAGGLSTVGAGPSFSAAPVAYNGAPPPVSQPDAQAASLTSSQATAHSSGPGMQRQAAPQRGADVSPQVNPQLSPQLNPQITPQAAPAPAQGDPLSQTNLFRPSQECSPQSVLNAAVPVAVLAAAENKGVDCDQANSQANSFAHARAGR
ncbi:hypothetical protein [Streptomyces sp. GESEQ-35]|uniref:hypothetical protein n=1 Tax=Streptomyces sp. GESEQ-35 TaxID=2812657 RepID=UPI001B327A43|nr:hypothetical protein [Streptomyces sp. GESEQ-35]